MDWKWVKISNRLFTTSVAMVTYVNIHKKQQQTNKQKSNTIWSLLVIGLYELLGNPAT